MNAQIIVLLSLIVFNNQWKCLTAQTLKLSQVNLKISLNFYWNIHGYYMFTSEKRTDYHRLSQTSQNIISLDLYHPGSRKQIYHETASSVIQANSFPLSASSLHSIPNPLELTLEEASYPGILGKGLVDLVMWVTDQVPGLAKLPHLDRIKYQIPIQPPYFQEHVLISRFKTLQPSFGISLSVQCDEHVYGKQCDTPCKPYSNYECTNEGKKLCLQGWDDPANNCRTQTTSCSANPCINGGTCVPAPTGSNFTCTCPTGFGGPRCKICSLNCNTGICLIQNGKPTCLCPSNASGSDCGSTIDPCAVHNLCKNGGKCHTKVAASGNHGYMCDCPLGFTGFDCKDRADACKASLHVCSKGSTCVTNTTVALGYSCLCPKHSTGLLCDTDVDECKVNPDLCDKGPETCINTYGGYYCEIKKEGHCKNVDCGRGGSCIELDYKYYCKCKIGWSGPNCNFSLTVQSKINLELIDSHDEMSASNGSEIGPNLAVLAMGLAVVAAGLQVLS